MTATSTRSGSGPPVGVDRLLPADGIPPSGYTTGFADGGTEYSFNASGYRCAPFAPVEGVRVVAIGCSYVFGIGLPADALFPALFGEALRESLSRPVTVWNLALPGTSNDYIARLLHLAVPALDPHLVLVNFTHADRREYAASDGALMPVCTGWHPPGRVGQDVKAHFEALTSEVDDDLNLFRNYKSVASLLAGRAWLWSAIAHPLKDATAEETRWGPFVRIRRHVDPEHYAGTLGRLDLARDGSHPGPASHRDLAARYLERCRALKYADALRP